MKGRRLATIDEIIAIESPNSDETLARLETWATDRGIGLSTVDVGDDISDVYDETSATLGVTLGGDGTFLEGIKTFAPRNIPLIGVNTGTLAFLARVEPDDLEAALDETIRGRASVDSRQQVRVDAPDVEATGINDVMLQQVPPENPIDRKITRLDVYADDEYVGEFDGTGLAVSTPTGSTGVSLSANGPVHYPVNNHTLQIVPLHTHKLGVRPIVVSPSTEIRIETQGQASMLVDGGRAHTVLSQGDEIVVTGAEQLAHVVRTSYDDHFFTAISKKLGWGIRDAGVPEAKARDGTDGAASATDPTAEEGVDTIERALTIATEAAEAAGEPLRELHGQVESIDVKSDKSDIVTEADHQADRVITTVIRNEFPDHAIFSEESVRQTNADGDYTWVVDPLDGTGNFAHGNPNYSISIGLLEDGVPVMGVVYIPETDELFSAIAGGDVRKDSEPIVTTDRDSLDESMLISGYDPDGTFLTHFYQESRGVRRLGSAALNLCYLASGSADAVWERDTYPWDIAAGLVIARAAGAEFTDETGEPFEFSLDTDEQRTLLGSNGSLHPEILDHLESGLAVPNRSKSVDFAQDGPTEAVADDQ
ncbi:inositol monophosphatase (plasmid) [Haloterrigena turkmenica DSM 5511]|uniref:NAD kinase n=1 Tax=Haloterrigena turkmenica (strain ATCC 51198 / DSM 5511 / JCM 9101 / NCIMB 13204 / VKM B-1734 / 4k) TaxID=543526 RepID=D2RZY4_HALTV|nr:inositol monophosphatase family protein [Haloterrigena turkmenica]ADB62681.1 inositol monophosphatase [Haloterrigena turkmenica DSM 5511]